MTIGLSQTIKKITRPVAMGDPFLQSVGNFLLGLADMLAIIIERLYEFGEALITRANEAALKSEGRT